MNTKTTADKLGFTLLEILIVVIIIGLLAILAGPALTKARMESQNTRFMNDLRQFRSAIQSYILSEGTLPQDGHTGTLPPELTEYIRPAAFEMGTTLGGSWDTETNDNGVACAVGVADFHADDEQLLEIDAVLDDGDLTSGSLRKLSATRYYWVIQEL